MRLRPLLLGSLLWLLAAAPALAQSSPGWTFGYVPTVAQWNAAFAGKQDYLGAPPLLTTGGTMTGPLVTAASTAAAAGLNLQPGAAPTVPNNGDLWTTSSSIFVRINGVTYDLVGAPCANCALTTTANTFTASPQLVQGLTTTQPGWFVQITGDSVPRVHLGLNSADGAALSFGSGSGNRDATIQRVGAGSLRFGGPDAASPVAQTLGVQNVLAGTSNTAGANLTINGSRGTGTASGGDIAFQVAPLGSTGSTQNPLVTAMSVKGADGGVVLNGAGSGGLGTISTLNTQNGNTNNTVSNLSTGTGALAAWNAQNSAGLAGFGIGGTGFTSISALQNKAYVLSNAGAGGIAIYNTGANPVDFYVNAVRVGGFTGGGAFQIVNSLAIGGATIGGNAFAVTGTTLFNSALTYGGVTLNNAVTGTGNMVLSAGPTISGVPKLTGLSSGTCANGLAIDASNNAITVACPGAAAAIQVGTTTVTSGTTLNLLYNNAGVLGNGTIASFLTAGNFVAITGTTNATISVNAAAKSDQQAGTSNVLAVTPLHQQDHDSAAKAWAVWTPSTGALLAGYNATVSRSSAGTYVVTFTTPFASANYSCQAGATSSAVIIAQTAGSPTASTISVFTANTSSVATDATVNASITCHGRQ